MLKNYSLKSIAYHGYQYLDMEEEVIGSNPVSPANKFPIWFEFNMILLIKGID